MTQHKWQILLDNIHSEVVSTRVHPNIHPQLLQHSDSECTRGKGVDRPQWRIGVKVQSKKQTIFKGSLNISLAKKELFAANSVPRLFFVTSICSDMKDYVWPARSCNSHHTYLALDTKEKPFRCASCSAGFARGYDLPFPNCTSSQGGG